MAIDFKNNGDDRSAGAALTLGYNLLTTTEDGNASKEIKSALGEVEALADTGISLQDVLQGFDFMVGKATSGFAAGWNNNAARFGDFALTAFGSSIHNEGPIDAFNPKNDAGFYRLLADLYKDKISIADHAKLTHTNDNSRYNA